MTPRRHDGSPPAPDAERPARAASPRGALIVLEGIDGAGTTTQARRLVDALRRGGRSAHSTREPSDGPIGRLLRDMLAGAHQPVDATTLGLLFAADRADHLHREVEPALARGDIVVSDRWYHSSLAYQGTAEDRAWIRELNSRARRPDLTIFVEVDANTAAERRAAAGRSREIFDDLPTQERVARGYREVMDALSATEPIAVVDGNRGEEAIAREIAALCAPICGGAGAGGDDGDGAR